MARVGFALGYGKFTNVREIASLMEQAEEREMSFFSSGARFVVSPTLELDLIPICRKAGIVCITGAASPTEVLTAMRAGTELVKIFPADCLGGPSGQFVKLVDEARSVSAT